jgi:hypothetical protein
MTDHSSTAPAFLASSAAIRLHFAAVGLVALLAAIFVVGYPLLISLVVLAAFVAIAMMVGLTAIDLVNSSRAAAERRPAKAVRAAAQAA